MVKCPLGLGFREGSLRICSGKPTPPPIIKVADFLKIINLRMRRMFWNVCTKSIYWEFGDRLFRIRSLQNIQK